MASLFDLSGRIAVVSGASRGIGREIALILARHGAHVVVASRKLNACEDVAAGIAEEGGSAEAIACHIGRQSDIDALDAHLRKRHGRLDILVNNAATNPYFGHVLDTDPAAFDKTVEVNLRGTFFMSIAAGRLMREHGGGVILNVASVNALTPVPAQAIYSATKAAIVNMTRAFAKECGNFGIRVNALLPGLTETRFTSTLFADRDLIDRVVEEIPVGRHAVPVDMAGAALYFCSDASAYTSGSCLVVDGGMSA